MDAAWSFCNCVLTFFHRFSPFQQNRLKGPFYGDAHFLRELARMEEYAYWLKPCTGELSDAAAPYSGRETRGILFVSDPQLRSPAVRELVCGVLARDGAAVMTGTAEKGGFSADLLERRRMELLPYPVHQNCCRMDALASANAFDAVIPYHCARMDVPWRSVQSSTVVEPRTQAD